MTVSTTELLILFLALMGPTKALVIFAGLSGEMDAAQKRSVAFRTVIVASAVTFLFLWGGGGIIKAIHVGIPAVKISGGIILLLFALDLVLGGGKEESPTTSGDIAVFPLAMPLIASPQGIVILITFGAAMQDSGTGMLQLYAVLGVTMGINLLVLLFGLKVLKYIPPPMLNVVLKLAGILLCAMAVQLVIWGMTDLGLIPALGH